MVHHNKAGTDRHQPVAQTVQPHPSTSGPQHPTASPQNSSQKCHRTWGIDTLASFDRAIALNPEYAGANWNKSLLKLLMGEYLEGWKLYEWRWKKEQHINILREYHQPLWLGDESLIFWYELEE
jgi:hypothetical protein